MKLLVGVLFVLLLGACTMTDQNTQANNPELARATFAGGCFWCMEPPFENLTGVVEVYAGYTGGHDEDPTYNEVTAGGTGHVEAVEIVYDPSQVTYKELLRVFWKNIDPTDADGQFADRGEHYKTAIFYHNEEQKKLAEESKKEMDASQKFDGPIVTAIKPYDKFFKAEEYHQDYYKKNPIRYGTYKQLSGRAGYLKEQEKKFKEEELREKLTDKQYQVTQHGATEAPFENEYWDHKEPGIYVDVVSGDPLFSSTDKYDSGTGWPSFTQPIEGIDLEEKPDFKMFVPRTEVKSKSGSHLGHVFNDGPPEEGGERFCINSAALRFVHKDDLEKEGYGKYAYLFEKE